MMIITAFVGSVYVEPHGVGINHDLLDNALPSKDTARLSLLALGVIGIPVLVGLIGVAHIGEGITYDRRDYS
jgi:hypothetical protein